MKEIERVFGWRAMENRLEVGGWKGWGIFLAGALEEG